MAYDLEQFCSETRATLQSSGALEDKLARVSEKLAALLANPAFVASAFADDTPPGQRLLYRDDATDFHVLAHVQRGGKSGMPHSHGTSWAIYGSARGFTDMTEWRRVNPESEPQAVLEPASKYRLEQGRTHFYAPHVMHFDITIPPFAGTHGRRSRTARGVTGNRTGPAGFLANSE